MNTKHSKNILLFFLLLIAITACTPPTRGAKPLTEEVWENITYYFGLDWLTGTTTYITFIRIVLFLIIFLVLFELFSHIPGLNQVSKRTSLLGSLAFAALVAVFIPPTLLITIALTYTGFFAFILVGIPAAVAIWLAYSYEPETSKGYLFRAILLLIALWIVGVMVHWSGTQMKGGGIRGIASSPDTVSYIVQYGALADPAKVEQSVKQSLEALATFGTWAWWILFAAILYNVANWLGGKGTSEQTLATVTSHSTGLLSDITNAWKGVAAKGIEKAVMPQDARRQELQLEISADKAVKQLNNASILAEHMANPTILGAARIMTFRSTTQAYETQYMNSLENALRIVRDELIGLTALPNRQYARLPPAVQRSLNAAYGRPIQGNRDVPNMLVDALRTLQNHFRTTMTQQPPNLAPVAQQHKTRIDNFIIPLLKALVAANRA